MIDPNKINYLKRYVYGSICGFLIGTAFCFSSQAQYDSSLQRSQFMGRSPVYERNLLREIEDRRSIFLWQMFFDLQTLGTDQNTQSQTVGFNINGKLDYKVMEQLDFRGRARLSFQSGRSQDLFGDLEPDSGIYPKDLRLRWRPLGEDLELAVGQISQSWFNESLFIGSLGFPGLLQRWIFQRPGFKLSLTAQELIPTSSTLATRVQDREATPSLFTQSIEASYQISLSNQLWGRFTLFQYNDLPSKVAFWSRIYGNSASLIGNDINNAQFLYGFQGWMGQWTFEQKFSERLSAQFYYSALRNNRAPVELSELQKMDLQVVVDMGSWIVSGRYSDYFIEADAVPAFYNSALLGHNNRSGNAYGIALESKDWGVQFAFEYYKARLLRDLGNLEGQLQQDNQETFYFTLETLYDYI